MTIQLTSPAFGASKKALEDQLNRDAKLVHFTDPMPFGDREFTGDQWLLNRCEAVVMDPETRRRFAKVCRGRDNKFKVL